MVGELNLTYSDYQSDTIGNSLLLINSPSSKESSYRIFPAQSKDMVYCSFLIMVGDTQYLSSNASTNFFPFFSILPQSDFTGGIRSYARLYCRKGISGNSFQIAFQNYVGDTISFYPNELVVNTTYLFVVAYKFSPINMIDSVYFWINPDTHKQPNADIRLPILSSAKATDLGRIEINYNSEYYFSTPDCAIDAIHVGVSWSDIMGISSYYQIGQINTKNYQSGVADSNGIGVITRGVVYGFNQDTNGLKFLFRDTSGGITVVNKYKKFGYAVNEGDSIEVRGTIYTERGLVELIADTILYKASGRILKLPTIIQKLNEQSNNDLVRINKLRFVTTQTDTTWQAKTYYLKTDGLAEFFAIQISPFSYLFGKPLPKTQPLYITGIGTQVSSILPFAFDGYYLLPRTLSDVLEDTLLSFNLINPTNNISINLSGNSTSILNFDWTKSVSTINSTVKYFFEIDSINNNFSSLKLSSLSNTNGADTFFNITSESIANILNLKPGQTFYGHWRVRANFGNCIKYSDSIYKIIFYRGIFNGINDNLINESLTVFPNPIRNTLMILNKGIKIESVFLHDNIGKSIKLDFQIDHENYVIDISSIVSGEYYLLINTTEHLYYQRIYIE